MGRILFGFIVGVALLPIVGWTLLSRGRMPVAVTDPPIPYEDVIAGKALHMRIDKELIQMPPLQPDEKNFVAGARIYAEKCAVCHGYHGKPSALGDAMFPAAPSLWEKHQNSPAVGVSDDPPGETYWKVANGIRLTGMPEFRSQLSNDAMWQVSLLLANADKPLPPEALLLLRGEALPRAARISTATTREDAKIQAETPGAATRAASDRQGGTQR
ncbi:MAG TPA: cytochrome c [Terracidiphilus sp.]|nr:cytochrome c [Terracidiphilus sp.]